MRCDELPAGVDYATFDYGVNSGISRAAKVLQRLLGVEADGEIGPNTLAAAAHSDPAKVIGQMCDERLAFLQGLKTWKVFGSGWGRRVREVHIAALVMAKTASAPKPAPAPRPAPTPAPTPTTQPKGWRAMIGALLAHLLGRAAG